MATYRDYNTLNPQEMSMLKSLGSKAYDPQFYDRSTGQFNWDAVLQETGNAPSIGAGPQPMTNQPEAGPYAGAPEMPEFNSLIGKKGLLQSPYQLKAGTINPRKIAGYGKYKSFATGVGPSEYAQEAEKRLDLKTALERDRIADESAAQAAMGRSTLAMRGGLSGGARERLATSAGREALEGRQAARQAQLLGLSDIMTQDAGARQQALGQFVGLGADIKQFNIGQKTGAKKFNIQQALAEQDKQRQAELEKYKQQGALWAAGQKSQDIQKQAEQVGGK